MCNAFLLRGFEDDEYYVHPTQSIVVGKGSEMVRSTKQAGIDLGGHSVATTNYPKIYLLEVTQDHGLFTVMAKDSMVDFGIAIANRDEFRYHSVASQVQREIRKALKADCQSRSHAMRQNLSTAGRPQSPEFCAR